MGPTIAWCPRLAAWLLPRRLPPEIARDLFRQSSPTSTTAAHGSDGARTAQLFMRSKAVAIDFSNVPCKSFSTIFLSLAGIFHSCVAEGRRIRRGTGKAVAVPHLAACRNYSHLESSQAVARAGPALSPKLSNAMFIARLRSQGCTFAWCILRPIIMNTCVLHSNFSLPKDII